MGQLNYTTVKINDLLEKIESFPESVSDGKTPVFVIGTVSTLDPGMSATASVTQDGVDDQGNPKYKLNLGIPKGLDGGSSGGGGVADSVQWANVLNKPSWIGPTKPTYTASEVGALPSSTTIPSKTSQLTNDRGYLTSSGFKTINGQSIVGSGNIVIESSGGGGTPSGEGGNVKVTNASGLGKDYYYAFKPSENGSVEGTFSLIPDATESKEGLMSSSNYRKLYDMKPVIALPIAVLEYNAETTSETIEAMLKTAFELDTSNVAVYFIYIAGALQGEYNSSFQKFYIGDRECMLGGNVVEDGSSVSQATLEFSYVDGGKLHTVAITMVVSDESGSQTYTYSAKVLESGDDTYYLPVLIAYLKSGAKKAEIDNAFGGEGKFSEAITAAINKKKLYIYHTAIGLIPVSSTSLSGFAGSLSFLYPGIAIGTEEIKTISESSVVVIYLKGYPLKPEVYSLTSSSDSDTISTAVGGESGLEGIIQAVKDGNRLVIRGTLDSSGGIMINQDVQCNMYQEADNGDMILFLSGKGYGLWGATGGILNIKYTKSSNTFSCEVITD